MKETKVVHGIGKKAFKQAGATLLEALSFLAIAAIVVIGATSLLTSAFGSSDTNTHQRELVSLKTAIKSYLSGQGTYTGATNDNLVAAGLVPSTLAVDTATTPDSITNAFGGAVSITGTATTYSISSAALPKSVCVKLAPQLTGFTAVSINGTAVTPLTNGAVTAQQAVTGCTTDSNTLLLTGN